MDMNRLSGSFRSRITERVLSPDLAGPDSFIGIQKPTNIPKYNMAVQLGKEDTTNGVHLNKHIYLYNTDTNNHAMNWCNTHAVDL